MERTSETEMTNTAMIDRNAVHEGDTIHWHTRNGGHAAEGQVTYTIQAGAYVLSPAGGTFLIEWERIEGHTPKAGTR